MDPGGTPKSQYISKINCRMDFEVVWNYAPLEKSKDITVVLQVSYLGTIPGPSKQR